MRRVLEERSAGDNPHRDPPCDDVRTNLCRLTGKYYAKRQSILVCRACQGAFAVWSTIQRRAVYRSRLAAILENRPRKVARPNASVAVSRRLNRDFHLSAPERDDRPIDLSGGLSVSNGLKPIDIAPPVSLEGTMARPVSVEGTSLPTPAPADIFDLKTVFLAPVLKNEPLPARLIPSKTTHDQSGDENGDQSSLHRYTTINSISLILATSF